MTAAEFELRYREQADPWAYRSSAYEHAKYGETLRACGRGPFSAALELGGSIGVFSALLAPRCEWLTTIDFSASAVRSARRELAGNDHVTALLGAIPADIPAGPFDLVVASEILYYLGEDALRATLVRLEQVLAPGGRLVAVHWRPRGPERPHSAAAIHDRLCALPWIERQSDRSTHDYLLHVLERR